MSNFTCADCGQPTIMSGVCGECSCKRFDAYPRLIRENNRLTEFKNDVVAFFKVLEQDDNNRYMLNEDPKYRKLIDDFSHYLNEFNKK